MGRQAGIKQKVDVRSESFLAVLTAREAGEADFYSGLLRISTFEPPSVGAQGFAPFRYIASVRKSYIPLLCAKCMGGCLESQKSKVKTQEDLPLPLMKDYLIGALAEHKVSRYCLAIISGVKLAQR